LVAVVLLSADRWFKGVAWAAGTSGLADDIFGLPIDLRLFINKGAVFSLPAPSWLFWPLALLAAAALAWAWWRLRQPEPYAAASIAFVLIGGLSNVIDRLMVGGTIDYLIFFDRSAVNLADGMILGGALAAYLILRKRQPGIHR
jgi:signal peptidase II